MRPYSKINIGDIFESPLKWMGSGTTYLVVDKADGLIEVRSSYQHSSLPETIWKKPSDRIFLRKMYNPALELMEEGRAISDRPK